MSPRIGNAESRERQAPVDRLAEIDLYDLLSERGQIAHVWSVVDVLEVRPDLDEDQAWEVLQSVDATKDATVGVTWDTLLQHADCKFPHDQKGGPA